jgi:Ca-activated chloride channel homolog
VIDLCLRRLKKNTKKMKKLTTTFAFVGLVLATALFALACTPEPKEPNGQLSTPIHPVSMNAPESEFPAITFKTGLDNNKYLYSESGNVGYYYVEAKAREFAASGTARTPLNLSLVIDHSGSMQGDKLKHAKLAAQYVIDQLSSEDYVSIVQYDDVVDVVSTSNRVGDKQLLKRKIESIQAAGSTNLGGGMLEGYKQVKSTFQNGFVNRVLLLSDGLANVGITKTQNLEHGITISTFGLGLDYNENLMTNIAENGSGNYYFIRTPEEISSIFQKELRGLLNVVAQNATLTIDLPTGLVLTKVFGYTFERSGDRVTINFRDIFSGETKAVLLKFAVQGNASSYNIASTLTFNDATTPDKAARRLDAHDRLALAASIEEFGQSISATVKSQVVLFESNEKLEEAMREVDAGNFERARAITSDNAAYLEGNINYVQSSKELQTQMSSNASYQTQISNVEVMNDSERKMMQKSSKVANYETRKKR